jgi:hypothetical protein
MFLQMLDKLFLEYAFLHKSWIILIDCPLQYYA